MYSMQMCAPTYTGYVLRRFFESIIYLGLRSISFSVSPPISKSPNDVYSFHFVLIPHGNAFKWLGVYVCVHVYVFKSYFETENKLFLCAAFSYSLDSSILPAAAHITLLLKFQTCNRHFAEKHSNNKNRNEEN